MSILFNTISNDVACELDVRKTTKQMWNTLEVKSGGVTRICKAPIQSLKRDYENLLKGMLKISSWMKTI